MQPDGTAPRSPGYRQLFARVSSGSYVVYVVCYKCVIVTTKRNFLVGIRLAYISELRAMFSSFLQCLCWGHAGMRI